MNCGGRGLKHSINKFSPSSPKGIRTQTYVGAGAEVGLVVEVGATIQTATVGN